jgi:PhnB protein
MAVKAIPDGYHSVTPYLVVPEVATLLDFLTQAFEAQELHRMPRPDGTIMHAEVRIGDSRVMLGEPMGDAPPMLGALYLYVNDVDAVYTRALHAGATSTSAPADPFYGDRSAGLKDPIGNQWWIATHQEDVPPEEIAKRAEACRQQH